MASMKCTKFEYVLFSGDVFERVERPNNTFMLESEQKVFMRLSF